ncbi:MAG TPA: c-type cytochrome [Kofleriaceae bacterium]|nr:c-type cytochrome [Kofleriaceae bacterium]
MRALALALALAACRSSSEPPKPAPAPEAGVAGAGSAHTPEELVALACTGCHGPDLPAQQRLTAKQWDATVKKMSGWGALVDDKDVPALSAYLASRYNGSAAPYVPPETSEDALAAIEPTDDGAYANGVATRGRELYTKTCGACHAPDARGSSLGTNLVDRYLLFRATDFAAIVRAGRGRMPAQPLRDPDIADVLAFLRTLGAG